MIKVQPNLFIVGFQKCGSTTLSHLLNQHPDIVCSKPKETFAMVDEDYENFEISRNVSAPDFTWNSFYKDSGNTKYLMEGSVCNFYQKTAMDFIDTLESKKLIFIIRDPIKRLISNYEYYTVKENSSVLSLIEYIEVLRHSVDRGLNKFKNHGSKYGLLHGRYQKYLGKWRDIVDPNDLHVVLFEDLIKDHGSVLVDIEKFLGISPFNKTTLVHENSTEIVANRRLHFYLKRHLGGLGLGRLRLVKNFYRRINLRGQGDKEISRECMEYLMEYYKEEYILIESLRR